jgi:ubiquinone/menaquinone biosynthesis C-methylase UbiE
MSTERTGSAAKSASEVFDEYDKNYSDTVNKSVAFTGLDVDFFTKVKAGYILDICERAFGAASTVRALDVGCGVGNFHRLLQPHFAALSGVDVSAAAIAQAEQRHEKVDYRVYDGHRLPYDDNSFDLAFTICVMHHVPPAQWPAFSREMRRVIRPGGVALVFEHNPQNPLTLRAVNNCPFDEDAVLLRSTETAKLMHDAGFAKIDTRFILSIPAAGPTLRKIDRAFSRLPFGAQYYVQSSKPI